MIPTVYIIMGVSGCGKSTIGKGLATALSINFYDGDDFHSFENINKMSQGTPLTDQDRYSWLIEINKKCKQSIQENKSIVFACSALKNKYRELIAKGIEKNVIWIYLEGSKELILNRLEIRSNHFMPLSLLESQFSILEVPENALKIDISSSQDTIIQNIMNQITKAEFGIIGLGVMGKSLARNFANKGVKLSLFNRYVKDYEEAVAKKAILEHPELSHAKGFEDLEQFVLSLERPRKIFIMIKAGQETHTFLDTILPLLEPHDILIDGGNSHYLDTKRNIQSLEKKQIHFIGAGVSGGEKGALTGPAIMPSGSKDAYKVVQPFLELLAAKDNSGKPCCSYIGVEGSGHYVKMIHNGIEYAEMQLLAETYSYLRYVAKKNPEEISIIFAAWNNTELSSFLLEITSKILLKKEGDSWLIDLILDSAGNKGTGNWTTVSATELGIPAAIITAALFSRYVSTIKESIKIPLVEEQIEKDSITIVDLIELKNAYQLARIINHQQGFMLLKSASLNYNWNLNLSEIARIWTNGCIIRSHLIENMVFFLKESEEIFSNSTMVNQINTLKPSLKNICIKALVFNLPIPCFLNSLDYINTLHNYHATANIIQAQRNYFGSHQYQKINDISGKFYHTNWE